MTDTRNRIIGPDENCIQHGTKYGCQIARGSDGQTGVVLDEHGEIRWRYGVRQNSLGRSRGNPFNKPDFVVLMAKRRDR
jgi:hypothetical protein